MHNYLFIAQTFDEEVTYATPVKTASEPDTPTSEVI